MCVDFTALWTRESSAAEACCSSLSLGDLGTLGFLRIEPGAPRRPQMCLLSGSQHLCSAAPQGNNVEVTVILKSCEKMWNFVDQFQLVPLVGHKIGSDCA